MAITLPTKRTPADSKSPKRLFIYSAPKSGKTTAVAALDDCLLIDLEKGAGFVSAMKVQIDTIEELGEVISSVKKAGKPYRYGAIDTTTKLEEIVVPLANKLYKQTQMGKDWDEDSVLSLPRGAGYLYLRKAYQQVMAALDDCFERVIYLGHLKDSSISKEGKEVAVRDIDLTGKLKSITCASTDAIAFMYRKENQTILSFRQGEDIISGARPLHLKNRDIVILESDEKENLTSYWDKIYID